VRRFLINPGQACSYKLGQLAISRHRGDAEKELGPAFDVKSFHDMVVGAGSLPLSILETQVKAWVAAKKGSTRSASQHPTALRVAVAMINRWKKAVDNEFGARES
jgi:hypothetical protein